MKTHWNPQRGGDIRRACRSWIPDVLVALLITLLVCAVCTAGLVSGGYCEPDGGCSAPHRVRVPFHAPGWAWLLVAIVLTIASHVVVTGIRLTQSIHRDGDRS